MLDCPAPGCGFLLQSRPRAAFADQVSDLVEGDEVGHLSLRRWNTDVERARLATASLERTPGPSTRLPRNPVRRAQLINMTVEDLRVQHPAHR